MKNKILKFFNLEPTNHQTELINRLADFVSPTNTTDIFLLKGYAGTGKTTIISALVKALSVSKVGTVLLAPTGRAAKVFSSTANMPAYTIHKKIYRAKSKENIFSNFVLDFNKHKNAIFIIDEASMISNNSDTKAKFGSGKLLDDLIKYIFSGENCKIIFSGDTAQLPPVGMNISPAMDANNLEFYGKNIQEYEMTDVVRQSLNSGILYNATLLRKMISNNRTGIYPRFKIEGFDDIKRVNGTELIETISDVYGSVGIENTIVITRSNKRANQYNQGIRQSILYKEHQLTTNDLVMIVKNNYFWKDEYKTIDFIANGDIVHISKIKNFENQYDYNYANAEVFFPDYSAFIDVKLMLDVLEIDGPALNYEDYKKYFNLIAETYSDENNKKKRFENVINDEYLNALQIKFAYAVTCHKAQGGQWNTIFIDQAYLTEAMLDLDFLRWLYTAITRATDKIYFVNFKDDFFQTTDS